MREKKLPSQTLLDFQQYLLSRKLVPEKSVTIYAYWANRYLKSLNMGSGNRNKVFFLSFLGWIFFQLIVMAEGRQAALFTTYINLSPNLRESDSRWKYSLGMPSYKNPPSPPFCLSNDRKIIQGGGNRSLPLLKGDLEGFYDPASIDFGVALLFRMTGRENRLK